MDIPQVCAALGLMSSRRAAHQNPQPQMPPPPPCLDPILPTVLALHQWFLPTILQATQPLPTAASTPRTHCNRERL